MFLEFELLKYLELISKIQTLDIDNNMDAKKSWNFYGIFC